MTKGLQSLVVAIASGSVVMVGAGFLSKSPTLIQAGLALLQAGWIPLLIVFGVFFVAYGLLEQLFKPPSTPAFRKPIEAGQLTLRELGAIAQCSTDTPPLIAGQVTHVLERQRAIYLYLDHRRDLYGRIPAHLTRRFPATDQLLNRRVVLAGALSQKRTPSGEAYEILLDDPTKLTLQTLFN